MRSKRACAIQHYDLDAFSSANEEGLDTDRESESRQREERAKVSQKRKPTKSAAKDVAEARKKKRSLDYGFIELPQLPFVFGRLAQLRILGLDKLDNGRTCDLHDKAACGSSLKVGDSVCFFRADTVDPNDGTVFKDTIVAKKVI